MNPAWAETLERQCRVGGVPFHFKQWGHWAPEVALESTPSKSAKTIQVYGGSQVIDMRGVGKSAAGRLLGGKTWDQLPSVSGTIKR